MKLLSISVAAYNVEKTLPKLLDSILKVQGVNQHGLDNVEILIVDDGSKDKTKEVSRVYESRYPNIIRYIGKKNGGHGSTINRGILEASGKYFKAIDGDDWVDSNALNNFLRKISNVTTDIIISDVKDYYVSTKETKVISFKDTLSTDVDMTVSDAYSRVNWFRYHNIFYKTELLKRNKIHLDENTFYVDTEYMLYPLVYAKDLFYVPETVYVYKIGDAEQSTSREGRIKNLESANRVTNSLLKFYTDISQNITDSIRRYIMAAIVRHIAWQTDTLIGKGIHEYQKTKITELRELVYDQSKEIDSLVAKRCLPYKLSNKCNWIFRFSIILYKIRYKFN